MKKLLGFLVLYFGLCSSAFAQFAGPVTANGIVVSTRGQLPKSGINVGSVRWVTDTDGSSCSASGSTTILCRWTGAAWVSGIAGSGAASPGNIPEVPFAQAPVSPVAGDVRFFTDTDGVACNGGGAVKLLCSWGGSSWEIVGSGVLNPSGVITANQCAFFSAATTLKSTALCAVTGGGTGIRVGTDTFTADVDVSALSASRVVKIPDAASTTVVSKAPTTGQVVSGIAADGTVTQRALVAGDMPAAAVQTGQTNTFGAFLQDFSAAGVKLPSSTTRPATCAVGQIYMDTDATSGQRIYACETTNTWVLQGSAASGGVTGLTATAIPEAASATTLQDSPLKNCGSNEMSVGTCAGTPTGTFKGGQVNLAAKASPSTPASGIGATYVDSTTKKLALKDDVGVISTTVVGMANPADDLYVQYIGLDGVPVRGTPPGTGTGGSGGTGTAPKITKVRHTGSQSLTAGTPLVIAFDTELFDDSSWHDTVTNNSRITFATAQSCALYGGAQLTPASANGTPSLYFRINGTTDLIAQSAYYVTTAGVSLSVSTSHKFVATDYVQLIALSTTVNATIASTEVVMTVVCGGNASGAAPQATKIKHNASQALVDGVPLALAGNTETYDDANWHDLVTNNSRVTFVSAQSCSIFGAAKFTPGGAGATSFLYFRINGSTTLLAQSYAHGSTGAGSITLSSAYKFAATDYLELIALSLGQDSAVGVNESELAVLCGGTGAAAPQITKVRHGSSQSLTAGVEVAAAFNAEVYDDAAWHDTSTNNSRITFATAQTCSLFAAAQFTPVSSPGTPYLYFRINGSTTLLSQSSYFASAAAVSVNVATGYKFSLGDYVEIMALSLTTGSTIAINEIVLTAICGGGMGATTLSTTISVRKGDNSGACNLVVEAGLITSTTC